MRKIFKKLAFFFVAILSLTVSSSYSVKEVRAEDQTVTMTSFSATNADMDNVVSYTTAKGGGTSNPAINGGVIRLYQNSAGTGGGNITIKVKEEVKEGYSLSSVTIGSSMATSIAYTIETETTKSAKTSLAANGKYTKDDINASSITFYCMGTSSSSRLYVNYLSVTYYSESGVISNSVYIAEESIDLYVGDTYTITPDVKPEGSTYKWTNTNPLVASLDENTGKVKAESIGSTTITVTHDDDSTVKDSIIINVLEKPFYSYEFLEKIFFKNETKTLGEYDWNLSGSYEGEGYWHRTDKGQQFGSNKAAYSELYLLSVNSFSNVTKVTINTSGNSGTAAKLNVKVGDINLGDEILITSSSTDYIVSSNNGLNGNISFNYSQTPNSAIYIKSFKIYCDGILSSSININNNDLNLIEGEEESLTASVYPSDATIKWSSSDNSVATVDSNGKVKAVSIGNAMITASIENDSSVLDSINVNVYKNPDCDLESLTPIYTISNYLPGVDGATNEVHKLDNNTIITTNNCNFNSKLSIYQNDGNIVIESKKVIDKIIVNCYSNSTNISGTLNAYGSLDMESWVDVKSLALHINESASNEEFDLTNYYYNYVKLDISNTPEVVINSITLVLSERVPFVENPISNFETDASLSFDYKYNVNENVSEPSWNLVTDANDIKIGDKVVIAAKNANYALSITQNNNNRAQAAIEKNNDSITFGSDVEILTIEEGTIANTYAFNEGEGYLYAASSGSNHLKTQLTNNDNGSWTISISNDGVATIKAQGTNTRNWMRYNSSNTPPIFSCYGSGQADICLYKYNAEEKYTDEQFSNVKIGFSASVDVSEFGDKTISKAGVIFTHTENEEKEVSKIIYSAINTNKEDALYQFLTSNSEDYKYIEKTYTVDNPLESNDNKYSVFGSMSVINGEVTDTNISRLSKTVTAAIYFVVDGEVIILKDKTYSVKGMLNEYSNNVEGLTEQQQQAVNVFKAYIEG